jgi:hypothetical protein
MSRQWLELVPLLWFAGQEKWAATQYPRLFLGLFKRGDIG